MDIKEEDLDKEAVLPDETGMATGKNNDGTDLTTGKKEEEPAEATAAKPTTHKEAAPSPEVKNQEDNVPFHQHPRWVQREQEWNKKIDETRSEYEDRIAQLEQRVEQRLKSNEPVKIPPFFSKVYGEDPELYKEYVAEQRAQAESIKEEAKAELLAEQQAQIKAQQDESTRWENWVVGSIQTLKDSGKTFDENRLKAIAIRDMPTDLEGNIDFQKAYNIMLLEDKAELAAGKEKSNARKELAAQTESTSRGESAVKDYLTHNDIRKGASNY